MEKPLFKVTCTTCGNTNENDIVVLVLVSAPYWDDGAWLECTCCSTKTDVDLVLLIKDN
jgi:hypothetical protein